MGVFKSLKKKKVPDELPDLASDEIEKDTDTVNNYLKEKEKEAKKESEELDDIEAPDKETGERDSKERPEHSQREKDTKKQAEDKYQKIMQNMPKDDSFFEKLENEISNEVTDLDKLEEWYEKKISGKDIVSDMKDYWEKQKNDKMLVKLLGRDYQKKILEKTNELQDLEKEWQEKYFELVEKEEKMKDVEEELKNILGDFVKACKKRKNSGNQTKTKSGKKKTSKKKQ